MEYLKNINTLFLKYNIQYWFCGSSLTSLQYPILEICLWKSSIKYIKKLKNELLKYNIKLQKHKKVFYLQTPSQTILIHDIYIDNDKIISNYTLKPSDIYPIQYITVDGINIPCIQNMKKSIQKQLSQEKTIPISNVKFEEAPYYSGYLNYLPIEEIKYAYLFPIPNVIHQIWIGGKIPDYKVSYMNSIRQGMNDYMYKLWTNDDLTRENFPLMFNLIQDVQKYMQQTKENRYAQIGDLMRLEIMYNNGGVYIDTNMECVKHFGKLLKGNFVVCNEQPCGLECETKTTKEKYLSNGFFASIPYHPILKQSLKIKGIDFSLPVNKTTGPFYFRKCVGDYPVTVLPTDYIYPYVLYLTTYRQPSKDKCIQLTPKQNTIYIKEGVYIEFPCKKYPRSYLICHFVLGGTWIK
jgi:mannosyltransferase OCH1-like enzyme